MMPLVIYASWGVTTRVKEYMVAFLLLETLMLGVFMALDLVLFYLFFEAGLIPMFLIIGIWGGKNRIYASFQILPLYPIGVGFDADCDDRNVCRCRHSRHPNIDDTSVRDLRISASLAFTLWAACKHCCSWPSSPHSR